MGDKSSSSGSGMLAGRGTSTVAHVCQSAVRCSNTAARGLAFGQGISLLVAGTGVFSQYLARRHVRRRVEAVVYSIGLACASCASPRQLVAH